MCAANNDPNAMYSTYRVVATCLMGNNAGTFKKYGKWVPVGAGDTSRTKCNATTLSVNFEIRK